MAVHQEILRAAVDELSLDPLNPRLGRKNTGRGVTQERVLELMRSWSLEELAISFVKSSYWPQEALVVHEEELYGTDSLVVVEGNRRLAALKLLKRAVDGDPVSSRWGTIAGMGIPAGLFDSIPYLLVDDRSDIVAFLGFRHVTGIKEWSPAEKAEYIGKLIDDEGFDYREAARTIGSKADTVRRNYAAYRILLQLEALDDVEVAYVEERFSVLFLSLREVGVRSFLGVDLDVEPDQLHEPVGDDHMNDLRDFAAWLFGTPDSSPLFSDSRYVGTFARVLESDAAIEYLRSTDTPSFELAVRKAGADKPELMGHLTAATDNIEQALSLVHLFTSAPDVRSAVERLGKGSLALVRWFPDLAVHLLGEGHETDSD